MKHTMLSEAKAQGLSKYFTGKPCPRGHVAERYVVQSNCSDCQQAVFLANPGLGASRNAWQKAKQRNLLCSCCSQEDFLPIYAFAYKIGHEVDHRHPSHLGGKHCLKNLQPLTVEAHKAKSNGEKSDAAFERAMALGKCDSLSTPKRKRKAA